MILAGVLLLLAELVVISTVMYPVEYYQSKLLSLVILTFLSYLLAHFMSYPRAFYFVFAVWFTLSIFSFWKLIRNGKLTEWFDVKTELVFLIVFSYFLFLRWLNPDIFGAEKFMDSAFISSILHSRFLPPLDPFLAGYRLNCYYYFGHVLGASITLMSFTSVQYGYNIAIAVIAAYSASTLYGLLKSLGMKMPWLGVIFTLFTGDLYGFYELLRDIFIVHKISWLYYWNSTRVIPGTINEFPYFSFLHADFHAHVVAIPLFILSISLFHSFFSDSYGFSKFSESRERAVVFISLILMSGILYLTNSWDSPVFLLCLSILVFVNIKKIDILNILAILLSVVSAYIASTTINSASAVIHTVRVHSPVIPFLLYFSVPIIYTYLWVFGKFYKKFKVRHVATIVLSLAVSLPMFLRGIEIVPVLLPLLFLSVIILLDKLNLVDKILLTFAIVACFFTLLPEFIAIDCRMNTVFKFYEVSWILFGIPASFALESILLSVLHKNLKNLKPQKRLISAVLLILFLTTFAYPIVATPQKCSPMRFTLDGMEFTKYFGEYRALLWAQKHLRGTIISASYNCYTYGGRFPAFTGNPTVIGWAGHEVQWRGMAKMLGSRMLDVKLFYTNPLKYWNILKKYNVRYVILGYEERKEFGASRKEFLPLIGKILKPVYSDKNVVIYAVRV